MPFMTRPVASRNLVTAVQSMKGFALTLSGQGQPEKWFYYGGSNELPEIRRVFSGR